MTLSHYCLTTLWTHTRRLASVHVAWCQERVAYELDHLVVTEATAVLQLVNVVFCSLLQPVDV